MTREQWAAYYAHKDKTQAMKAREMLALKQAGLPRKQIARMYGLSTSMVSYLTHKYDPARAAEWAHEEWH
jgi:hypothetical protein